MRPVLLELAGFGSFREPTTVDFRGAEYFALVGPTGAGKSTVIDAMTFALYGSVARWDHARTVALALAPTVARGTVRFVFDIADTAAGSTARYVVARELRRAAGGTVSVRTARLERLRDPSGTGAVDEETDPVADGAAATTQAVTELLGLPFEDFTTCVVLPQGEFAEFLHAKPAKRQETLVRLLGLELYDVIAKEANLEARREEQRAALLTEQLDGYVEDTEAAERAAAGRIDELARLRTRVAAAAPAFAAAAAELVAAQASLRRLDEERVRLEAVAVPVGLDDLADRRRSTATAHMAARADLDAAEKADTAAREALAEAPVRAELEQVRRHHAERAAVAAELPSARERQVKAHDADVAACADADIARAALDAARSGREATAAGLAEVRDVGSTLAAERDTLRAVSAPAALAALDVRRAASATRLATAGDRLTTAERADADARAALAAAPDRAPIEQARRDRQDLDAARATQHAARVAAATAREVVATAATEVERSREHLAQAQEQYTAHQRADLAAALRPALIEGEPCPVCEQPVATLPAATLHQRDGDLDSADRAMTAAQSAHDAARRAEAAAAARQARAEAEREASTAVVDRLTAALAAVPVPAHLAATSRSAVAARSAPASRTAALAESTTGLADADADVAAADAGVAGAAELGAAEIAPGAAATEPDAAERDDASTAVVEAGEAGIAGRVGAAQAGATQFGEPQADGAQAGGAAPGTALIDAAAAAPVVLDAALAHLDALSSDARSADGALRVARAERDASARADQEIRGQVAAATAALRSARDPLVVFGAPAIDADDPVAGWAALQAWADAEAATREAALPAARARYGEAQRAHVDAEQAVLAAEQVAEHRRREETAAARAEQEARGAVTHLETRERELTVLLRDALADAEAAAVLRRIADLEDAVRTADAAVRSTRAGARSAEGAAVAVEREVDGAWAKLRSARDPLVALSAPAVDGDDVAEAWATLVAWAGAAAAERVDGIAVAEQAAATAATRRAEVGTGVLADLGAHGVALEVPATVSDGALPDPAVLDPDVLDPVAAATAVATEVEAARWAHARIVERRAAAAKLLADRDAATEAQQVAKLLGQLLRSDAFPRWLVASALDALVADASVSLAELSGGQFELTHDHGEFLVVDHTDADAHRPVKTLSGGETFQASLALALALSAQMSGLAVRGAARLESIVLDEGFGTLDEANLESVASALETLATRGDRVVGVITHVPALAERVPVRFAVRRDQRGSSITREGG